MTNSGQKFSRSQWPFIAVTVVIFLWTGWNFNLFSQTTTEDEATETLQKLQIHHVLEPNVPTPDIYKSPPEIVEQKVNDTTEWKLFYFCKYLTSEELKQIIHEQFATKLFDQKGKETKLPDYTVSSNPATNQLIVRCPNREDAEAVLKTLEQVDVLPIQVKIDCLISEIYADFTFDRETTIAIDNLFGEDIAMKPGGTAFGADVQQLISDDEYLPAFPGASLRELIRARMGLKIGYLSTAHNFAALVDLLESRGFLKILMNPTLEIVNGKTAKVQSTQHVPLQKVTKYIPTTGEYLPQTETEYVDVVDSLEITPHVFADGYIGLETTIMLGAKNTPDGVKQVPILTKKEITSKENRIRQGESLIIGGIRKTEKFGVARGVPLLKDIPLIGFLFSGEDTEQRAVETIFILTPTISTNGRATEEVMAEINRKHHATESEKGLNNIITDPFGINSHQQAKESKAMEAEHVRLEAESEKEDAHIAAKEANDRADKAENDAQKATDDAAKTKAKAEKMMDEAKEMMSKAEAKSKAADEAIAAAEQKNNDSNNVHEHDGPQTKNEEKTNEGAEKSPDVSERPNVEEEPKA